MVTKHPPRSVGKRIALLSGERLHVGIDVHKATCHLTVWSETRGELTGPRQVSRRHWCAH